MNKELLKMAEEYRLIEHIKHIKEQMGKVYATDFASLSLPYDDGIITQCKELAEAKKKHDVALVIVVGIGGSSLGAKAIYQAIKGSFFYTEKNVPHLYFLETLDKDYQQGIYRLVEDALKKGREVLLNVITKSGTTTETLVNFEYMLVLIQKYRPTTYADYVVVTSDINSSLHVRAQKEHFSFLEIPRFVGGRFSVFSASGLFPLLLVGIDAVALRAGAQAALKNCLSLDLTVNSAAQAALSSHFYYTQGYVVQDAFFFSVDLEGVGKWWRQLVAESLGKECDQQGAKVSVGILPTVSIGTNDLHSMVQLYLSGPRCTYTTFVGVQSVDNQGNLMNVFLEGTSVAYKKNDRPFSITMLQEKDEYHLAHFMQCKMMETMFVGFLFNVNPFDQPKVEDYKKEVASILQDFE